MCTIEPYLYAASSTHQPPVVCCVRSQGLTVVGKRLLDSSRCTKATLGSQLALMCALRWDHDVGAALFLCACFCASESSHPCLLPACCLLDGQILKGLDCSEPGASSRTLPIKAGYWRSSLNTITIRQFLYLVRTLHLKQ